MQTSVFWTAALDTRLRALRAAGLTWEQVALEMELGRSTVLERGRRIGAKRAPKVAGVPVSEPDDRPARPPGHPSSWSLLTDGTVLAGQAYPYPVFL
jgi:hypothetical protein